MYKSSPTMFKHLLLLCSVFLYANANAQNKDFNLKIDSYRGTIQWEQSFDLTSWSPIAGATTGSIATVPSKTTYYRAKITEAGCSPVYSDVKAAYIDINKTVPARLVKGTVALPAGTAVQLTEISVLSMIDSVSVKQDGSFNLLVADSVKEDLLMVTNKTGEVLLMAHYFANEKNFVINANTTSLALLISFPLLKPVDLNRKASLISFYKQEVEFTQLVTEVERLSKTGADLFSVSNTELIRIIGLFVKKPINTDRLRIQQNQRKKADLPITITSFGTSVKLENTAEHTYAAEIYKKDGQVMIERFTLYGTELEESIPLQVIYRLLQGSTDIQSTRTFDLKAKKYTAGEYEIRLWSGLLSDDNQPNKLAIRENLLTAYAMIIEALVPSPTDWIKDDCIKSIFDASINSVNPINMAQAAKNNSVLKEYVLPVFKNYGEFLTGDCLEIKSSKLLKKLFFYLRLAEKVLENTSYAVDWTTSPYLMEACEYVNDDGQTSTCFVIEATTTLAAQDYTGDDVDVRIKTIANANYYPKEPTPVSNVAFQWTSWKGGGTFSNNKGTDQLILFDQTDQNGFASAKWKFSCDTGKHVTRTRVNGIPNDQEKDLFTMNVYNPGAKVRATGTMQTGQPSKVLETKLLISVFDTLDGLPMLMNRFNIAWESVTGSGSIEPSGGDAFTSSYSWTLGPEVGEQIAKATITAKNCNWPIAERIVFFKAATKVDTLAIIQSQQWKSTEFMWMGLKLDSAYKVEEETDSCGVLKGFSTYSEIYTTFQSSGDFQWSVKGNYKGDALVNETSCQKVIVDQSGTESIPLAWKWEYIPSLKIIRVTNTDDDDALDLVKGENFDFQIISLTSTEIEIRGVIPFTGAVTHLKLKAK
jgi:hypothetical protein